MPTKKQRICNYSSDEDEAEYWHALKSRAWRDHHAPSKIPATAQVPNQIPMPLPETKWAPGQGRAPNLSGAPVFFPDAEEFEDPLKYIASVRPMAEPCGICRIVPPRSWRPPPLLKESNFRFSTRIQDVQKLQRRTAGVGAAGGMQFGFMPGPEATLSKFKAHAERFKRKYFASSGPVPLSDVEGEYWRIVEESMEKVEVLYGVDLDTNTVGSGFPKPGNGPYEKSGWNLNNTARLTGSMLQYEESDISGVVVPWLYLGMCFSSFCWHVEDHFFYSINYMHFGDPKIWYGAPRTSSAKLEEAMKKYLPDLFREQPDLLQKLVTQFSPSVLIAEGVQLFKAVQRPGDFIVTFPKAYHCGFSTGFNCAEAVNFAPLDWFSHGQSAVELYQKFSRKPSVSHDKLLFTAVNHCLGAKEHPERAHPFWRHVVSDTELLNTLQKAYKARVQTEHSRRVWLGERIYFQKMDAAFDIGEDKECFYCHYDLHLSAVSCECSPGRFTCLEHYDLVCKCPKERRLFLQRYDIQELYGYLASFENRQSSAHENENGNEIQMDSSASISTMSHKKQDSVGSAFIRSPDSGRRLADSSPGNKPQTNAHVVVVLSDDEEEQKPKPSLERKSSIPKPDLKVELLEVGTLAQAGWCSKESIFPAGFKSRILYYNFLDLSQLAYYTSEIVDCGVDNPYFKVTLEAQPTQCFVDLSIHSCWRSLQQRLNFEIQSRRKRGNFNMPPIKAVDEISGLEMFGLSDPGIKQVVEALDYKQVCNEYWSKSSGSSQEVSISEVLKSLFKKGDTVELWTLHRVLSSAWGTDIWKQGFQALADVLQSLVT